MQLNEAQISASKLADVFSGAFMDVSELEENFFSVKAEALQVRVKVDSKRKYIILEIAQVLYNISLEEASKIANKINSERMLARIFFVEIEGALLMIADYYLSFDRGLIAYHLVNTVKFFEGVVLDCVRENFLDNLNRQRPIKSLDGN